MNASWVTVDTSAWLWTVHLGTSAKHADLIPPPKSAKDMVAVQVRLVKAPGNVRYGSKADICSAKRHVRSTPKSGHMHCTSACPLWANSGHRNNYGRLGSNAATRGKITLISVNSPGCVSTSIEPPCCFTMMS